MNKLIWRNKKTGVVIIILIILFVPHVLFNPNPYASYDVYNKNNKLLGILQHYTQEKTGRYYLSLYYPEFKDEQLAEIVNTYKLENMNLDTHPQNGMTYISIDYAVDRILDRYIRLSFQKVSTYRKKNTLQKETTYYTYDEKLHRRVLLDDVLQGDYKERLQAVALQQKMSQQDFDSLNFQNFQIEETAIIFYKNGNIAFQFPRKGFELYFKDNI